MECGEKIRHATRDDAHEHQKALIFKNHLEGRDERSAGLSVYPCSQCGHWHVGHRRDLPLVWHYTCMDRLDAIITSGALKPARPRAVRPSTEEGLPPDVAAALHARFPDDTMPLSRAFVKTLRHPLPSFIKVPVPGTKLLATVPKEWLELQPLLWFSRNPNWEYSLCGRMRGELERGGLLRFGVPASVATLRWSDYLQRNLTPTWLRERLACRGYPPEWLATDNSVPLNDDSVVQVYFREKWTPIVDVDTDDFRRYLSQRHQVYEASFQSLQVKTLEARVQMTLVGSSWQGNGAQPPLTESERILLEDHLWHYAIEKAKQQHPVVMTREFAGRR
jgi:hypothetical protein